MHVAPARETRHQRALAMLADNPDRRYALIVDEADTDPVILTMAIRDVGTCELAIPLAQYDGLAILALIERQAARQAREAIYPRE